MLDVEGLLKTTLGCCGSAGVGYSGPALVDVLWKGKCGLLWARLGGCAIKRLVWATLGPLWWMCYGRASVGGRTEVPSS